MKYFIKTKYWHQQLTGRIAIWKIRRLQRKYKKLSLASKFNQTNDNLATLRLMVAREEYYKDQFSAWGKWCIQFSFDEEEYQIYLDFRNWLFPPKDFEERYEVLYVSDEAELIFRNHVFHAGGSSEKLLRKARRERLQIKYTAPKPYKLI